MHKRTYGGELKLPPVARLRNESFMVIRIQPTVTRFRDYKNFSFEKSTVTGKDIQYEALY